LDGLTWRCDAITLDVCRCGVMICLYIKNSITNRTFQYILKVVLRRTNPPGSHRHQNCWRMSPGCWRMLPPVETGGYRRSKTPPPRGSTASIYAVDREIAVKHALSTRWNPAKAGFAQMWPPVSTGGNIRLQAQPPGRGSVRRGVPTGDDGNERKNIHDLPGGTPRRRGFA
jgi:hypothetical protein